MHTNKLGLSQLYDLRAKRRKVKVLTGYKNVHRIPRSGDVVWVTD